MLKEDNSDFSEKAQYDAAAYQPLVSVVIIFLNEEKFLEEAIQSVFAQTYRNWELLLVDDGSGDGSTTTALNYAERCPGKVRYLDHEGHQNHGQSASRNLGIRQSGGQYIALLDADDVWLPHKLQEQVAILSSQPECAMVYGRSQYWHSWTGLPEDVHRDFVPNLGFRTDTLVTPPSLLIRLLKGNCPCPSDVLMRRELVDRVGGFEEGFRGIRILFEDQAFLAKVYLSAPVFVAGRCWHKYRLHQDSCCSVEMKAGRYHSAQLFFLNWLEDYLLREDVGHIEVWKTLHEALWPYRHPMLGLCHPKHLVKSIKRLVRLAFEPS